MRIAVIDDEPRELNGLSEMIRHYLEEAGYMANRIDTFQSAEEFLDVWIPHGYALVLLDIYMGGTVGD